MADKKVSQLTALTGANTASGDLLYIVDISEPVAADQSKKITLTEFQSAPISAGTANGVAFLNASKVLTTGSALTYNGTGLGVGISSAGYLVDISTPLTGTTVGSNVALNLESQASGRDVEIRMGDTVNSSGRFGYLSGSLYWAFGSTEQMRLTSTGLGIGTNNPNGKLDVASGNVFITQDYELNWHTGGTKRSQILGDSSNNLKFSNRVGGVLTNTMTLDSSGNLGIGTSSPASRVHINNGASTATALTMGPVLASGDYSQIVWTPTSGSQNLNFSIDGGYFKWTRQGSEFMRLDSSGNLGLGVAPSAWNAAFKAIEFGAGNLNSISTNEFNLNQNAFYGASTWQYKASGGATMFRGTGSEFRWFTAPSGTAGNPITFTQAMTLDASGNLGIGTSSPDSGFQLTAYADVAGAIRVRGGGTGSNTARTASLSLLSSGNEEWIVRGANDSLRFLQSSTERMRLDSSGNLGIGTSSPGARLHVGAGRIFLDQDYQLTWQNAGTNRARIYGDSANNFVFENGSGNTERARITSGGDLLVGDTATIGSARFYVLGSVNNFVGRIRNSNAAPSGLDLTYTTASPNNTGNQFLYCADSTAERASIRSNGGLANYSGNDVNLSDRREKTNFAPAKSYLDTICAIPVQTFEYIDQSEDDPGLTLGVVAQDVQAVAPELVMESNWGTADDPKQRLSIYQTDLQYALMKCIQELKAQNDELRARVAALESN